jgi:peptidyl-prolyl cis-trans isomerase A (cyclophilin A)
MTRAMSSTSRIPSVSFLAACAAALAACNAPPEPGPDPAATQKPAAVATSTQAPTKPTMKPVPTAAPTGPRVVHAQPVAEVKPSPDDPVKGKWTLEDATKGLPKGDLLVATIETDQGNIECKLMADKAPITVANFVGLARGIRPWKTPEGKWETKPAYDGTVFHRIVKGFMIQGGDAKKNGSGEAGYVIPDEIWEGATHDRAGLLCMANRGPNTNSAQFFITDDAATYLDFGSRPGMGYTIFGECGPLETIHKIASVKMKSREVPETPPVIKKVTVTRKAAPPAASASASASGAPSAGPSASASAAPSSAPSGAKGSAGNAVAPTSPGPMPSNRVPPAATE